MRIYIRRFLPMAGGFPHSEISGSKVIWHLAETYRSHNTSFIASYSQGIHHTPLHSCKEHCILLCSRHSCVCTPLYNFVVCGRKNTNASQTVLFVCVGDEKTRLSAIVFTRHTTYLMALLLLYEHSAIPRARRMHEDFREPDLIKSGSLEYAIT